MKIGHLAISLGGLKFCLLDIGAQKKADALKIKEQIERELAAGKYSFEEIDTDINVFWDEYFKWAQDHKQPKTLEVEQMFWRQFTEFAKPQKLGDVIPPDVERFKAKRKRDGLKSNLITGTVGGAGQPS